MIFRDRDVFFDKHGRIYITLGYLQPPDRVLAFLKYIPSQKGESSPQWKLQNTYYRRIFWGTVESVKKGLKENIPSYSIWDSFFGTELIEVPHTDIKQHFIPEQRIQEILSDPQGPLEKKVAHVAELLHSVLNISYNDLGIAGSILWRGHQSISDVNMNIYGFENAWVLQRNYDHLVKEAPSIKLRKIEQWGKTMKRIADRNPLTLEDVQTLFMRRKEIYYKNEGIGVMPILRPDKDRLPIKYGTEVFKTDLENIILRGEIVADDYSLFMPAIYELALSKRERSKIPGLTSSNLRILVYDGSFRALFQKHDRVEVSGALQSVLDPDNRSIKCKQVLVGTKQGSGQEYLRLLNN
ncbi:MAG: hypothetical protein ACFFBD_15480 [Candidatus Hodarchaeota archaeon]